MKIELQKKIFSYDTKHENRVSAVYFNGFYIKKAS